MFLLLIFFLVVPCKTDLIMMLVWGEPNDVSKCNNTANIPFTDCFTICYNLSTCVLAYQYENICYLCGFGAVDNVAQKTYQDDMKVAMKISSIACQSVYPVEGQVDNGYLPPTGQEISTYQITFNSGQWALNYTQVSCPTGWILFIRQKGPWCMNLYYSTASYYNWPDANSQCGLMSNGSVLSGIENSDEYNYIFSNATAVWRTSQGMLWLGAKRRPECTQPSWNTTVCNNTLTTFEWTDGFTTGTDGFIYWVPHQPDGLMYNNEQQACLAMWMCYGMNCYQGYTDDTDCTMGSIPTGTGSYVNGYAYVCGVQPSG